MVNVIVSGAFDDVQARQMRFLQEAARLGPVHALLWTDEMVERRTGKPPRFPLAEREYVLGAVRFVDRVAVDESGAAERLLDMGGQALAVLAEDDAPDRRAWCAARGVAYHVIPDSALDGFPELPVGMGTPGRKKAIVTGCYDYLHSGHVRFFEEVAALGDLYVVVGHDANVRLLKGERHPLFPEAQRRYMASSIRHVTGALISTGHGWMDAAPEIDRLRPDLYVVNEDGDKPEKREFCAAHGLEYVVLKRAPRDGLPRRESTALRGF
ncbi:MAG: adenylyltransferase/cytidyltransferase family protein [Anaerolineae bacterium]|nr:adenylyltransferase/cytidyltransferase family protein [Anaerolineae bacterium]